MPTVLCRWIEIDGDPIVIGNIHLLVNVRITVSSTNSVEDKVLSVCGVHLAIAIEIKDRTIRPQISVKQINVIRIDCTVVIDITSWVGCNVNGQ